MRKWLLLNLSIKYKFILGIVAILSLSLLTLFLSMLTRSEGLLIQSIEQRAQLINSNFSVVAAQGIQESSFSNLQMLINEVAAQSKDISLLVVSYTDGTVIATSDKKNYPQFGKIKNALINSQITNFADAIHQDDSRNILESIRFIYESGGESENDPLNEDSSPDSGQIEPASETANRKGKAIGFIYVALNTDRLQQARADLWLFSTGLAMVLLVAGAGVAFKFGSQMTHPIQFLAREVRSIAAGNLDNAIHARGTDEVGQLIADVEKMRVSIKDLTENLEAKVEERTQQLEEAHARIVKLEKESLEQLMAGGFAHEMRNALTGASIVVQTVITDNKTLCETNSETLEKLYNLLETSIPQNERDEAVGYFMQLEANEERMDQVLRMVRDSTARAMKVTSQIFEYSQLNNDYAGRDVVDIKLLLIEVINDLSPLFDKFNVGLKTDIVTTGLVKGSATHFKSILTHLLENAVEAFGEVNDARERLVQLKLAENDAFQILTIHDNGNGIPDSIKAKIYEPFFSTKPTTGTGLGLSYVRKLIQLYSGVIKVDSKPEEGTTFTVSIPLSNNGVPLSAAVSK